MELPLAKATNNHVMVQQVSKRQGSDMKRMNSESRRATGFETLDVHGKDSVDLPLSARNAGANKVNYRQNLITRGQLLEMRKTLLEKCEEIIEQTYYPFGKYNLKTAKIFNDLLNFHSDYNVRSHHNLN